MPAGNEAIATVLPIHGHGPGASTFRLLVPLTLESPVMEASKRLPDGRGRGIRSPEFLTEQHESNGVLEAALPLSSPRLGHGPGLKSLRVRIRVC